MNTNKNAGRWVGMGRRMGADERVERRADGWHAMTFSAYSEEAGQTRTTLGVFATEDEAIDAVVASRS